MWNLAQGIHSKALEIFIIYLLLLQLPSQFPILIWNYNLNQKPSNPQPNRQKSGPTEIWLTVLDLASRVPIMKACRPCWVSWTTNSSDAIEFLDFNLEFFSLAILSNTSFVAGKRDSYMCGHCAKTQKLQCSVVSNPGVHLLKYIESWNHIPYEFECCDYDGRNRHAGLHSQIAPQMDQNCLKSEYKHL